MKSTNTEYRCDCCGDKVNPDSCVTISILVSKGMNRLDDAMPTIPNEKEAMEAWAKCYWKYKIIHDVELCRECVGERVNAVFCDADKFGLNKGGKGFLQKLGFMRIKK